MRLVLDTSGLRFMVTKAPEAKKDQDGKQRADRRTGELLYTVQLTAFDDEEGATVLSVTMAGQPPQVTVSQMVTPIELEAIPWAQNGRNGTAFRAKVLDPVKAREKAA